MRLRDHVTTVRNSAARFRVWCACESQALIERHGRPFGNRLPRHREPKISAAAARFVGERRARSHSVGPRHELRADSRNEFIVSSVAARNEVH